MPKPIARSRAMSSKCLLAIRNESVTASSTRRLMVQLLGTQTPAAISCELYRRHCPDLKLYATAPWQARPFARVRRAPLPAGPCAAHELPSEDSEFRAAVL